jgi:fucose permease
MLSARTTRSPIGPLALASLGFVSLGLPEGLLGVAWPSIRESFGLGLDALGALLATFATGYFVASALSGRTLRRFGIGSVLSASCAITGVSLLGYSAAPTWPTMVALGAVLGAGAGTIDAGLNTYAAVQHGPRVLNWMHAAFGLGAAVGPLVMTAILQAGLPWTLGYVLVAAAQLCLSLGYALLRDQFAKPATSDAASPTPPIRSFLGNPLVWISVALFFVYVGLEATAGQWSFTLLTQSREVPATLAGLLISGYWASLTIGRLLFGIVVSHVSPTNLLRACMLVAILASAVLWQGGSYALLVLGLVFAPIFPVLIAETPGRLGLGQTPDAIGLQVAAAVVGGAAIPALVGFLAARIGLEVVGACLVVSALLELGLYEALVRRAFAPRQSARSQSDAGASAPPRA